MKFLCLHGNGTNSSVFSIQTSALRHELEHDELDFEFVEAATKCPMALGVETLVSPNQDFFGYYNPKELSTLSAALDELGDYIAAEGPFDAVMAFSSGAVLAAMYMVVKQRRDGIPPFRCAVLLSSASSAAERAYLGVEDGRDVIRVPTAHIWGSADEVAPTGGVELSGLCDPTTRHDLIHDAGHEIPRNGSEIEIARAIRRAVYEARRDNLDEGASAE